MTKTISRLWVVALAVVCLVVGLAPLAGAAPPDNGDPREYGAQCWRGRSSITFTHNDQDVINGYTVIVHVGPYSTNGHEQERWTTTTTDLTHNGVVVLDDDGNPYQSTTITGTETVTTNTGYTWRYTGGSTDLTCIPTVTAPRTNRVNPHDPGELTNRVADPGPPPLYYAINTDEDPAPRQESEQSQEQSQEQSMTPTAEEDTVTYLTSPAPTPTTVPPPVTPEPKDTPERECDAGETDCDEGTEKPKADTPPPEAETSPESETPDVPGWLAVVLHFNEVATDDSETMPTDIVDLCRELNLPSGAELVGGDRCPD